MNPQSVKVACGCSVIVQHDRGERRVVCGGGGFREPDEMVTAAREALEECGGGRAYAIRAEEFTTIVYTARPLPVVKEAV